MTTEIDYNETICTVDWSDVRTYLEHVSREIIEKSKLFHSIYKCIINRPILMQTHFAK